MLEKLDVSRQLAPILYLAHSNPPCHKNPKQAAVRAPIKHISDTS